MKTKDQLKEMTENLCKLNAERMLADIQPLFEETWSAFIAEHPESIDNAPELIGKSPEERIAYIARSKAESCESFQKLAIKGIMGEAQPLMEAQKEAICGKQDPMNRLMNILRGL